MGGLGLSVWRSGFGEINKKRELSLKKRKRDGDLCGESNIFKNYASARFTLFFSVSKGF